MNRIELAEHLKKGLFISAMMGILDGRTLARLGNHACMVQLGALFTERINHMTKDPRFVYPHEEEAYSKLLRREIAPIRAAFGAIPIAWNTAPGDANSAIRFAAAAELGGADMYELNFNGGYGKIIKKNIIRAMVLPQNHDTLMAWIREVVERSGIPVAAKFFTGMHGVDFGEVGAMLSSVGVFGMHLNVRSLTEFAPNYEVVEDVRRSFEGVLMCSGRVTTIEHVNRLFDAGADCVGVAKGLVDDAFLISKLSVQLGGKKPLETPVEVVDDFASDDHLEAVPEPEPEPEPYVYGAEDDGEDVDDAEDVTL